MKKDYKNMKSQFVTSKNFLENGAIITTVNGLVS